MKKHAHMLLLVSLLIATTSCSQQKQDVEDGGIYHLYVGGALQLIKPKDNEELISHTLPSYGKILEFFDGDVPRFPSKAIYKAEKLGEEELKLKIGHWKEVGNKADPYNDVYTKKIKIFIDEPKIGDVFLTYDIFPNYGRRLSVKRCANNIISRIHHMPVYNYHTDSVFYLDEIIKSNNLQLIGNVETAKSMNVNNIIDIECNSDNSDLYAVVSIMGDYIDSNEILAISNENEYKIGSNTKENRLVYSSIRIANDGTTTFMERKYDDTYRMCIQNQSSLLYCTDNINNYDILNLYDIKKYRNEYYIFGQINYEQNKAIFIIKYNVSDNTINNIRILSENNLNLDLTYLYNDGYNYYLIVNAYNNDIYVNRLYITNDDFYTYQIYDFSYDNILKTDIYKGTLFTLTSNRYIKMYYLNDLRYSIKVKIDDSIDVNKIKTFFIYDNAAIIANMNYYKAVKLY